MEKIKIHLLNDAYKDYIFCFKKAYPVADYIALNISSPNTKDLRNFIIEDYIERSNLIKINYEEKN